MLTTNNSGTEKRAPTLPEGKSGDPHRLGLPTLRAIEEIAMDERPKPKENWESVIKGSRKLFKSEDIQKILRELDIPFTNETIKKIIDIQSQYCDEIQLIDDRPSMGEVCAMLKKITTHGKKYKEWLRKIDDESLLKMAVAMYDENFMADTDMRGRIDRSLEDVILIIGIAERVLKDWQSSPKERRGGPRFKHPIREYVKRLAQIFQEATGKKATVTYDAYSEIYTSKFFDFVSCCSNRIPNHPSITDATLAKYIKELPCPSHTTVKKS